LFFSYRFFEVAFGFVFFDVEGASSSTPCIRPSLPVFISLLPLFYRENRQFFHPYGLMGVDLCAREAILENRLF
jgi:hypothetical protein